MSNSKIRRLLEKRLETMTAGVTNKLGAPRIAWENIKFDRADLSSPYLSPYLLPATNDSISLQGNDITYAGVFQITVTSAANAGVQAAEELADTIAAWFPNNLMLADSSGFRVFISNPTDVSTGINDETGYNIPISVYYRANT